MTPTSIILLISCILFCIGSVGFIVRQNKISRLLMIGLLFQAAALNLGALNLNTEMESGVFLYFSELIIVITLFFAGVFAIAAHSNHRSGEQ